MPHPLDQSQADIPTVLVTPRALTQDTNAVSEMLRAHGFRAVFSPPGVQPSRRELTNLLPGCVGWIAGVEAIDAAVIGGAKNIKVISRFGSGTNNIDMAATKMAGISVCAAGGANAQSVAELALALTLDCLRGVTASAVEVSAGGWNRSLGQEIGGVTIAVVGYGAIGKRYASMLASLGAHVVVIDPVLDPDQDFPLGIVAGTSLAAVIAECHVVSLHCPPGDAPVIDKSILDQAQPGLIVINTARSELVDDDAVLEALESDKLKNYAVDAFDTEPPQVSALLRHPRVIATPHIAAYTAQAIQRTLEVTVDNLVSALQRHKPLVGTPLTGTLADNLHTPMSDGNIRFHWLGQAGFLIRASSGAVVAIDPYLSNSLAEKYSNTVFPHQRMSSAPIGSDAIARIDLVIATHGHTDHLDPGTLPVLAQKHPHAVFVVPHRVRDLALQRGMPADRLISALGGESLEPIPGVRLHPVPAAHEELDITGEGSAFLGFVIEIGGERVYHSGDCVPYGGLAERLTELSPSIALLPVNGRDEYRKANGVPGNFTLEEALELCEQADIPHMIAHHWGMFEFNTVAKEVLVQVKATYGGAVSWYIPSQDESLER
jgi:phosphoglycerate dehydrogenase-like enzyme/L-ascorbate metabolism protein UlaG (beta-lactamase superfamily)